MPKTVLVADDSVTIQKVVALSFSDRDFVIESVSDGDHALEKARMLKPDIVLADVFMPGRNGYEVCADIKADPELGGTPVILLVGTFEPFDESEALRVKSDACLTKPFDTSELIETVNSLLTRKQEAVRSLSAAATAPTRTQINARTRESFLGAGKILDVFAGLPPKGRPPAQHPRATPIEETAKEKEPAIPPVPGPEPQLSASTDFSEEVLDLIVQRVVQRMSREVVREVAWEVIPDISETVVRQYLEEHGLPGKN